MIFETVYFQLGNLFIITLKSETHYWNLNKSQKNLINIYLFISLHNFSRYLENNEINIYISNVRQYNISIFQKTLRPLEHLS